MAEQNATTDTPLQDVEKALSDAQQEREDAKEQLTTSKKNLKEIRGELNTLRAEERRLGKEAEKKGEIAAKQTEESEAREDTRQARHNLAEKKRAVTTAASAFNRKAIGVLLNTLKEPVLELVKKFTIPGSLGAGYSYLTMLDNTYKSVASGNVLAGATVLDVLSSVLSVSSAGTILLLLLPLLLLYGLVVALFILPLPRWTEFWAGSLQRLAQNTPVKTLLSLLVLVFPLGCVAGVSYGDPDKELGLPKDRVCIQRIELSEGDGQQATSPEPPENCQPLTSSNLKTKKFILKTEEFILISSNSTYMFVRKEGDEDNPGEAIPRSEIVKKKVNDGAWERGAAALQYEVMLQVENHEHGNEEPGHRHDTYAAADHEHAAYITEELLRTWITEEMGCGEDRLVVSEFIRFGWNAATLESARKERAREQVSAFVKAWKKHGGDTPPQWRVFGFASADGERGRNDGLARQRAVAVKNVLCNILDCDANGTTIKIQKLGEDHPINGVANSRSARIAGCVDEAGGQPSPAG